MRILDSLVVSSDADLPTCLNPPMAVILTHCSPSSLGLAILLATYLSMSCLSSWLARRYPLTSDTVLDGIGGALMTLMFQPVSFLSSVRRWPSFPTTSLGLMASTIASPVSSTKLISNISAFSGIMFLICSSTLFVSSRVEGSGLMSTLRWMF